MKLLIRFILVLVACMSGTTIFAQTLGSSSKEEISLTVSSDGPTKDEALKNALRTAIEQAYGAFVSANTAILNDEVVKDEIVTVSNGAIKEYTEVSTYEKHDGNGYNVMVNATVSLPHLITYAKNHGSECEFAGKTFGMQMKLWKIQKENEKKALFDMLKQVEALLPNLFKWNLVVQEPCIDRNIDLLIDKAYRLSYYLKPQNEWYFKKDRTNYVRPIGSDKKIEELMRSFNNKEFYSIQMNLLANLPQEQAMYEEKGKKFYVSPIDSFIFNTLRSISLSEDEYEIAKQRGEECSTIIMRHDIYGKIDNFMFRNDEETLEQWAVALVKLIYSELNKLYIQDNTGMTTHLHLGDIYDRYRIWTGKPDFALTKDERTISGAVGEYKNFSKSSNNFKLACIDDEHTFGIVTNDTGLLKYPFEFKMDPGSNYRETMLGIYDLYWVRNEIFSADRDYYDDGRIEKILDISLIIRIPVDEIEKYSSFKIVRKD